MITITVTTDTSTDLYKSLIEFLKTENIPFTQSPVLLQTDCSTPLEALEQELKDVIGEISDFTHPDRYRELCDRQDKLRSDIAAIKRQKPMA